MLSIASWRSGGTKAQEPEPVEKVVPRPAPIPTGPASSVEPPAAPAVDGDHRGAARRPASALPSISGLTLSPYGAAATLVNISTSGLLAESGVPLKIGNFVKVIQRVPVKINIKTSKETEQLLRPGMSVHVSVSIDQ